MKPTGIEAADDSTLDYQSMKVDFGVPNTVNKLLALLTCDASEEINLYAFLLILCDVLGWKLIGWFNLESFTPPPPKEEEAIDVNTLPAQKYDPERIISSNPLELIPSPPEDFEAAIADNPWTEERLKTVDLRQRKLVERLAKIDSELRSILFK